MSDLFSCLTVCFFVLHTCYVYENKQKSSTIYQLQYVLIFSLNVHRGIFLFESRHNRNWHLIYILSNILTAAFNAEILKIQNSAKAKPKTTDVLHQPAAWLSKRLHSTFTVGGRNLLFLWHFMSPTMEQWRWLAICWTKFWKKTLNCVNQNRQWRAEPFNMTVIPRDSGLWWTTEQAIRSCCSGLSEWINCVSCSMDRHENSH